ncbi:MAG: hypothetical protein JWN40_959 [Phycisphaerales bacterium]|nr:hypothetical protein [Phycisphaerales bacterium]
MKSLRYAASAMLAAGMMAGQPAAFATDSPPIPLVQPSDTPPTTLPADNRLRDAISAIERAPDPSSAIGAYAKGAAIERDGVAVEQAFVKRLAALGLPEMAETQARDLSKRRPDDGVAWAVVAYMDARNGDTAAGLQGILIANRQAGDDPFVQRTAAQLMAYYDYKADRTRIDIAMRTALEQMRNNLRGKTEYAQAYERASDAYARGLAAAAAAAVPATPDYRPPTDPYDNSAAPAAVYNNYTYNTYAPDAPYTDPYASYYGGYAWWPSWWGPSLVVIDRPFFFHHRFDRDDFFGHDRFGRGDSFHNDRFGRSDSFRNDRFGHVDFGNRFDRGDTIHRFDGSRLGVQRSFSPPTQQFRGTSAPRFAPSRGAMPSRGGSAMPQRGGFSGGGRMGGGGGGRMGGGGGGGGGGRR